ncbi:protein of unknown function [Pararobbsia alpina]
MDYVRQQVALLFPALLVVIVKLSNRRPELKMLTDDWLQLLAKPFIGKGVVALFTAALAEQWFTVALDCPAQYLVLDALEADGVFGHVLRPSSSVHSILCLPACWPEKTLLMPAAPAHPRHPEARHQVA